MTILETLTAAGEPMTLTLLARTTGIPLATAAGIMQTLELRGYAKREVVGRSHFWRPTLRIYRLGTQLAAAIDLATVSKPALNDLADATGMPAHVGVLDGADVVYLVKASTDGFVQFNTYAGKAAPFNLTALGKAIVAFLPTDRLVDMLQQGVDGRGAKAHAYDPRVLKRELDAVRDSGYAVEDEEEETGIGCIAAPIFDHSRAVAGSVGVTGFSNDLLGDLFDQKLAAVLETSRRISDALGAPSASENEHHAAGAAAAAAT